jgi:hypothetical protein
MRRAVALVCLLAAPLPAVATPDAGAPPARMYPAFMMVREQVERPEPLLPPAFFEAHPGETFAPTYKLCVGTDGGVYDASVMSSIGDDAIDKMIMNQIRAYWTYKPRTEPVCYAAQLSVTKSDPVQQVQHPIPSLPNTIKDMHPHQTLEAKYQVCIDPSGRVARTKIIAPIGGGADEPLLKHIRERWTYKPRSQPACFTAVMKFNID